MVWRKHSAPRLGQQAVHRPGQRPGLGRPPRPRHLAHRTEPPPERPAPPDLTLMICAGIVLAAIVALLATPYLFGYLMQVLHR